MLKLPPRRRRDCERNRSRLVGISRRRGLAQSGRQLGGSVRRQIGNPNEPELTADILQVFTGLEADRPAGRYPDFLARPGIPADAALPRLDLKDAEAAKLDALAL